ncbi:hypothetical protein ACI2OX_17470 [Bacillus sp. N9]
MKRKILMLFVLLVMVVSTACSSGEKTETANNNSSGELDGNITVWHSFTQGPRLEYMQAAADSFMEEHPKVKIKIETFAWPEFYTKWTTGLQSGQVRM